MVIVNTLSEELNFSRPQICIAELARFVGKVPDPSPAWGSKVIGYLSFAPVRMLSLMIAYNGKAGCCCHPSGDSGV